MADLNFNLGDLGKLADPAKVLIEKTFEAVGGAFRPHQIRRVAQAKADAELIEAKSQIQIAELYQIGFRFLQEEAKRQDNCDAILNKALPQLEDKSQPQNMDNDWIANFFDKCRIISDDEMQQLWSKVYAGEANSPGRYSKRTVNLLGSLDKRDATLFTQLCGFVWLIGDLLVPLVYKYQDPIYADKDITFSSLIHLQNIGLISLQVAPTTVQRQQIPKCLDANYYGHRFILEFKADKDNSLELGTVLFTNVGEQLFQISGSASIAEFIPYIFDRWVGDGVSVASQYPAGAVPQSKASLKLWEVDDEGWR